MAKVTFVLFILTSLSLWAQSAEKTEPTETQAAPQEQQLKKIVVTGSYIKQSVDAKAPTPVSVTDSSRMLETGSFTVADALQENVAFNNVSAGSFLSLHGQTDADNLVLLNGLRLPKTAGGTGVNIDFLPATAIEKVEVLKDGASALYGSEALAGVVNILTKKDYTGTNFIYRLTSPLARTGQETTSALTFGKSKGKHNFLGILQFRKTEPIYYHDTDFGVYDVKIAGSLNSNFGNLFASDGFHRDNSCPDNRKDASGRCRMDTYGISQTSTGQERNYYTTYLGYGYDYSEKLKLDTLFIYTRRNWTASGAPIAMTFEDGPAASGDDYSIPSAIANTWGTVKSSDGSGSAFADNPTLYYSPLEELGTRISERNVDNFITQVRLHGDIKNWSWEFSTGHGYTYFKDTTLQGEADKQAVYGLITSGDFNPFKPIGAKDDLSSTAIQTWFAHTSDSLNTKALAAGPLFDLYGKTVSMAIGVEGQWQSFNYRNDPFSLANRTLSGGNSNQQGQRDVGSVFTELTFSPLKNLDIQLAGRFDKYSDFGSTVNPKLGIALHASEKVTFRGSYGTGFKAPDLLSIFQGTETNLQNFRDEVVCEIDPNDPNCSQGYFSVTRSGNRNLDPETAKHYNIGMVVTPKKNIIMTLDYWYVDGADGLAEVDERLVTRAQRLGFLPNLNAQGIQVIRDPGTGYITSMIVPTRLNSGLFRIRGIDFRFERQQKINPFSLGTMNLRIDMEHSHTLKSQGTEFDFVPIRSAYNNDWRNFIGVSVAKDNNFYKMMVRSYAGGDKDTLEGTGIGKGTTPMFSEYDLHYERFFKNDSSLSFGIKNLFDRKIMRDVRGLNVPVGGGAANTNNNFLGRTVYLGFNKEF